MRYSDKLIKNSFLETLYKLFEERINLYIRDNYQPLEGNIK